MATFNKGLSHLRNTWGVDAASLWGSGDHSGEMDGHTRSHPTDLHLLETDEHVELSLRSDGTEFRVTDRRLVVISGEHVRLDIRIDELRRIQFDIEAMRPATMVIVPHQASQEPQVLSVPRASLREAAKLLAFLADRLP